MAATTHQADAVIIGGGLAGIVAAIELLEAGRRVLIVDRAARTSSAARRARHSAE